MTIDHENTKGQVTQEDAKLLVKRMESLEAARPSCPIHVVLWVENSMLQADCLSFSLREAWRMDLCTVHK